MESMISKGYDPHEVEERWYSYWEENGLFEALEDSPGKNYSIVIPPPNVTGVLHMGHSLNITLQDILCRYRRLRGDNVLWMPGTDHAGIATQNVVEKSLAAQGIDRHQLGREKFIEAVWEWRKKYGSAIIRQLKRIGASCDWKRERFTMDEGLSKAVRKVFVDLYEQGLIYRGDYIINWCPRCMTALADLEVEYEETQGSIYYIHYPLADGAQGPIVATTRPETMLGDTAVAVHPDDPRYAHLVGKQVKLPLTNRIIPVISDAYVDMEFGTGALKITPAHDPNDFEIGRKHGLPIVKVIGEDGKMTKDGGAYEGLDRYKCRKLVCDDLKTAGLLIKIEPYQHGIGHCYRCNTIIEPNLSKQWFVKTKPLAEKAIEAVKSRQTKIIPEKWTNDYFAWMENIRDWCISRQIWWGHPIPAWTCAGCNHTIVCVETPTSCPSCGTERLIPDPDVLDTWFSSALWPFSTMGWPEHTPLMKQFYPTSVLVTGFDILFFWVARMMMMGIHFLKKVPFYDVYVHALVRDEEGKKMSKSTGNVIDPMDVIAKYGTDALRFTLAAFAAQGRDIKLSEKRIEGYRHFINKLWNAARFSLMHMDGKEAKSTPDPVSLPDRWILSRKNTVSANVAAALDSYRFNDAANEIYHFVWHEFCDWYLELIKPVIYGKDNHQQKTATKKVLRHVLEDILILLHPFVPFVTEELWHKLPGAEHSVMKAVYPLDRKEPLVLFFDPEAETQMMFIMDLINSIRNIRGEMNISSSVMLSVVIQTSDENKLTLISQSQDFIKNLARTNHIEIRSIGEKPRASATAVIGETIVSVLLEGVIDFSKEIARLEKEVAKVSLEIEKLVAKLSNDDFVKKAPESIIDKAKSQFQSYSEKKEQLATHLEKIRAFFNESSSPL